MAACWCGKGLPDCRYICAAVKTLICACYSAGQLKPWLLPFLQMRNLKTLSAACSKALPLHLAAESSDGFKCINAPHSLVQPTICDIRAFSPLSTNSSAFIHFIRAFRQLSMNSGALMHLIRAFGPLSANSSAFIHFIRSFSQLTPISSAFIHLIRSFSPLSADSSAFVHLIRPFRPLSVNSGALSAPHRRGAAGRAHPAGPAYSQGRAHPAVPAYSQGRSHPAVPAGKPGDRAPAPGPTPRRRRSASSR